MPVRVLRKPVMFARMRSLPARVKAGVAVKGPAAAYALVWEWGSVRFRKPGPKTVWGMNPDAGDVRIFTATAPSGYIRIHRQQFFDMGRLAVTSISFQKTDDYAQALRDHLAKVTTEIAQIMAKDAPIDSGALREGIIAVNQAEMEALLPDAFRPLIIGGASE